MQLSNILSSLLTLSSVLNHVSAADYSSTDTAQCYTQRLATEMRRGPTTMSRSRTMSRDSTASTITTVTITPTSTTTITKTAIETSTVTTSNNRIKTVTATNTHIVTSTSTATTTETTTSTSTASVTTISASAGFSPVQSTLPSAAPGPRPRQAERRDLDTSAFFQPRQRQHGGVFGHGGGYSFGDGNGNNNENDLPNDGDVYCIIIVHTGTITTRTTTSTRTIGDSTARTTTIVTTVTTKTVTTGSESPTGTTTTTATVTSTIIFNPTSTTTLTKTATAKPATATVYEACASPTNVVSRVNNRLITLVTASSDFENNVVSGDKSSAYACCVSTIKNPFGAMWAWSKRYGCLVFEVPNTNNADMCPNGQSFTNAKSETVELGGTGTDGPDYFTVGNGYCGGWNMVGSA